MYIQEHMSRPKGGEGASDCVHDVLVEVLSIALPYMDRVLREKTCHTTTILHTDYTTHRLVKCNRVLLITFHIRKDFD